MRKTIHLKFILACGLLFNLLLLSSSSIAQSSTVSTIPTYLPNNGTGLTTFNLHNANSYAILIDTIYAEGTSSASVIGYIWSNLTPVNGTPSGTISSNPSWILESSEVSNYTTPNVQQPILTNVGLTIPANTTIGVAVGVFQGTIASAPGGGFMRYYTVPSTTQNDTFTTGGVSIINGANVSYGSTSFAGTSYNHPRGFVGSIVFHPLNLPPCAGTPTANPVSAPDTVCSGTFFVLTGNNTPSSGIIYKWQQSVSGSGVWTDISGATSNVFSVTNGISSNTDYRFIVTCSNSNLSDTSNTLSVALNPNIDDCYCIPQGVTATRFIDDFSTTGSTINVSNLGSGFSSGGYGNFTTTDTLSVMKGDIVNFTTNINGGTAGFRIWADWNHDGTFDAINEVVYSSTSFSSAHSGTFQVPTTGVVGATRMRIVSHWGDSNGDASPCETNFSYGEFEDYTMIISCDTPPIDMGNDTTFCAGNSITISSGNTDTGMTYLWSTGETTNSIVVDSTGMYSVTITNANGCSNTDSINIEVIDVPSISGIDTTMNTNGSYTFGATNALNVADYSWNFGDGNTSTDEFPTHTYTQGGNYTVILIVSNECGSDTAEISINYTTSIYQLDLGNEEMVLYPNPAKDLITLENISKFKMESVTVYNILGQVIYTGKTKNENSYQLNVQQYASGIYNIRIFLTNGKFVQRKFQIQK